jgi:poly-beta-1,6-N-acetyl-D-glucosamine synthase
MVNIIYVVVTPVRDEEDNIRHTLDCMVRQTLPPEEWIIVDDGSRDNTGRIVDEYAAQYPWIRAVHRPDRGFRKPGGGVVDAFYEGYRTIRTARWEFLVKLDGDLSFEMDYFEKCIQHFGLSGELGIAGGTICYIVNELKKFEQVPAFHVRGATKIYRRSCWEQLGGLWPAEGWDTIDEIKANSLGWKTRSFRELHLLHHRPTGAADGFWGALTKYGRANYICGYHPAFMLAKCMRRLVKRPAIVGSAALMYGYLSGYLRRIPQFADFDAISYLRREQLARLCFRESIWK